MNLGLLLVKESPELEILLIPLLVDLINATVPQHSLNCLKESIKLSLPLNGFLHWCGWIIIHECVPLVLQESHPQNSGGVSLADFLYLDEVLKGFGHLTLVYVEVTCVQEVGDPRVTVIVGLTLSYLITVMRETKVYTT